MKFRNLISLLFLMWAFNAYSQISVIDKIPRLKVTFSSNSISKYEYESDEKIDFWDTSDKSVYKINPKKQRLEFVAYNSLTGKKEIEWNYKIIAYSQNDEIYFFKVLKGTDELEIWIWKDKTIVVINEVDYYYMVCEKENK